MSRIYKYEAHNGRVTITLVYGFRFDIPWIKHPVHFWEFRNREAALAGEEAALPCQCPRCADGVRLKPTAGVKASGDLATHLRSQLHGRGMWK